MRASSRGFATELLLKAGACLLLAGAAVAAYRHHAEGLREEGRQQQASAQAQVDAEASMRNAGISLRRMEAQQSNEEKVHAELEALRIRADRADDRSQRVHDDAKTAAEQWSHTLRNSPTSADLAAAGEAIRVCADLYRRADTRAGILARIADAARTRGLSCEHDYDSLEGVKQ